MQLSEKSIQEIIRKIQKIETRTDENMKLATKDLMEVAYSTLVKVYKENNLSNHISTIKKEITAKGFGFKIWTDDWVVIFNEYGTGVRGDGTHPDSGDYKYNVSSEFKDEFGRWIYYNDDLDSYITTSGMRAKHMFYDVEQAIRKYAKEFYSTAINLSLSDKAYQSFRESLR